MVFVKRYPIPIAGLILALFLLGDLLRFWSPWARLALGAVALALYAPYLLKLCRMKPAQLGAELDNPAAAGAAPAFTMATMLLGGYVEPFIPGLGEGIWYVGLAGHILLILWFSRTFLRGFSIKNVLPSWFTVYVGITAASLSAPVIGQAIVGQAAFWFALAAYICLLPLVGWRVWKVGEIPDPAKPAMVIFAMPASLLLAGYVTSFDAKSPVMVWLLLALSLFFYAVGLAYLLRLFLAPFAPSHSDFTFPLAISALAVKMAGDYTGLAWMPLICGVQTAIAAAVVLWVLARYLWFLFSGGDGRDL